jgi:anti-sigma factor RsiW
MTHEEIKEQLPLYVLGGLSDETVAAVEQHLAESCDSCAAEVREWQEVVGLLPLGVMQDGPSETVKERLMARVRRDAGGTVIPLRPRRWRAAWVAVPLAAAATLLLVFSDGWYRNDKVIGELERTRAQLATAVSQADILRSLLTEAQEKFAASETETQRLDSLCN